MNSKTLILFYFDEMSTKEIAEALGVPQGTVLWRLNFARQKIKKEVEKYEEESKTKLFAVPLPFLTLLFQKEAEQVPLKPMPASIENLVSASTDAASSEAGRKIVSEAIKKGTGIMKQKAIIGSIAAVLAVGGIIAVTAIVSSKKDNKVTGNAGKNRNERIEAAEESTRRSAKADAPVVPPTDATEEAEEAKATHAITDDSIFIRLDGMSTDEIIDNLWKTANIYTGLSYDEYYERLIFSEDDFLLLSKSGEKFSWSFSGRRDTERYISKIGVFSGMKTDPVFDGSSWMSGVHLEVVVEDEAFANELAEKILARLAIDGYTIAFDSRPNGLWAVRLEGENTSFLMQIIDVAGYRISFTIPCIGK